MNFRLVLENLQLDLKEKYIEYLIYLMKQFEDGSYNLEDLKYSDVKN